MMNAHIKSLNGSSFTVELVVSFDFTGAEADAFLAAKHENRTATLNDILSRKHPLPESGTYNAEQFRLAVGRHLADRREAELKQLPETV